VKVLAYIGIMAALGNALAIISTQLTLMGSQVALDLGHIGTFLAAIPGGPLVGMVTGALVGIFPWIRFGVAGDLGIWVGLSLIVGKAITGFFSGLVMRIVKRPLVTVIVGYVPECIFTFFVFLVVTPLVLGMPLAAAVPLVLKIEVKAWIEILFMAFLMESVFLSKGIVAMLHTIFLDWDYTPLTKM